jgi:galactitol-specific phosphotransferase system IIC component
MATYNKFTPAIENLLEGINAGTDSWVVKLATAVNQAAGTITEVANGNGYTTGGNSAATVSASQTSGTFKLVLTSPTAWTASGAGFTFRYAVFTNATTSTNVAYWDYGSSQAVASGETVTVTLDPTNGVFQAT